MSKICRCLLFGLIILSQLVTQAEVLVLPNQLSEIAEESFLGDSSLIECIVPNTVTSIGDRAFFGCNNLGWITIPENTKLFGKDVFTGCADDLLIRTVPGSASCDYARKTSIDYQAGTTYRALLIGQTYSENAELQLFGSENDVQAIKTSLTAFSGTPYYVSTRMNLSAEDMLSAIGDTFSAATIDDVSLLYFSGHGVSASEDEVRGALLGINGSDYVTADQLRNALDQIPGRKIIIIDACYSGNMIAMNAKRNSLKLSVMSDSQASETDDFTNSFIAAFSRKKRSNLASDSYYVLTAAAAEEESYEEAVEDRVMGLFTYHLAKSLGYKSYTEGTNKRMADANENGVITLQEVYQYTRKRLIPDRQHVQVYPENCLWFGILRE